MDRGDQHAETTRERERERERETGTTVDDVNIHWSIEDAEPADFMPTWEDEDESTWIPCLDFCWDSRILELVHVPSLDSFVIMPEYVRFDARDPLDPDVLRRRLAVGGALRKAIFEVRCAASIDRRLLAACRAFSMELESLIEHAGVLMLKTIAIVLQGPGEASKP